MTTELQPTDLLRLLFCSRPPKILDVRIDEDVALNPTILPTARRQDAQTLPDPLPMPGQEVVVVCHKGAKLSHGAAARLRARGHPARVLAGGSEAWRAAGLPTLREIAPRRDARPLIGARGDVAAAAAVWFEHRLVDPGTEVLLVPAETCADVADRFGGRTAGRPGQTLRDGMAVLLSPPPALTRLSALVEDRTPDATLAALVAGAALRAPSDRAYLAATGALFDAFLLHALQEVSA